jgi:hypothetical protein
MADDLDAVFGQADAPRALPPELRARLSDVLLAEIGTELAPDDAVAEHLGDVDAERALPDSVRQRMKVQLHDAAGSHAGRRLRPAVLLGTAAGLVAVLAAGVALTAVSISRTGEPGNVAGPPTATRGSPSHAPEQPRTGSAPRPRPSPAKAGGSGVVAGPSVVGSANGDYYARDVGRTSWFTAALQSRASAKDGVLRLTHVAPVFGPTEGGTRVVIRGADVRGVREVRFGGVPAPWVDARSPGRVVVVTPAVASAGRVNVTLRGPGIRIRLPRAYSYAFGGVGTWF